MTETSLLEQIDFTALTVDDTARAALRRRAELALEGVADAQALKMALVDLTVRTAVLEQQLAALFRTPQAAVALDPLTVEDPSEAEAEALEQPDSVALTAETLQFGAGWHKLEERPEGPFRWSGPDGRSTVLIPTLGARSGWIELFMVAPGKRPLAAVGLTFHLDGEALEPDTIDPRAVQANVRLPFLWTSPPSDFVVLEIGVDNLVTPTQWKPTSKDRRMLGVGLAGATVAKTS